MTKQEQQTHKSVWVCYMNSVLGYRELGVTTLWLDRDLLQNLVGLESGSLIDFLPMLSNLTDHLGPPSDCASFSQLLI